MMLSRIAAAGVAKIKLLSPRAIFECAAAAGTGREPGLAGGAFNLTRSWHPQLSAGVKLLAELSAACAACVAGHMLQCQLKCCPGKTRDFSCRCHLCPLLIFQMHLTAWLAVVLNLKAFH